MHFPDNLAQRHFKSLFVKAKLPSTIRLYVVLTLNTYSHIIPGLQELATNKFEEALLEMNFIAFWEVV